MADTTNDDVTEKQEPDDGSVGVISPDEVLAGRSPDEAGEERQTESVNEPAKVLRIGSMVKTLLDEVRSAPLDEKSRVRLREIYEQSIRDLSQVLSPDLVAELERMAPPFGNDAPSDAELRIAQAQLWRGLRERPCDGHIDAPNAHALVQQPADTQEQQRAQRQRDREPGKPVPAEAPMQTDRTHGFGDTRVGLAARQEERRA